MNEAAKITRLLGRGLWTWPTRLRPRRILDEALASVVALLLFLAMALPLVAQEARWAELVKRANVLRKEGHSAEALPLAEEAERVAERSFRAGDPKISLTLGLLAAIYDEQGRYAEAEPLFKRSLAMREQSAGPDHPDVARSLTGLAFLYYHEARYAEAEPLFQRALAIREKAFGPDDPEVAISLNNLASLYQRQGEFAKAICPVGIRFGTRFKCHG